VFRPSVVTGPTIVWLVTRVSGIGRAGREWPTTPEEG
jgi:hypothetical protein